MIIPRFNPRFINKTHPNSPERSLVDALSKITDDRRSLAIFGRYGSDHLNDTIESQDKPLYIIDGNLTHTEPPSEEVISELWKNRLLSYGNHGKQSPNQ